MNLIDSLSNSKKRISFFICMAAVLLLIIVDRYLFALIAQWREDQGANIYLGYHIFDKAITIGILNTVGMPNPNGHILIGAIFSHLPGLISVSWALGLVQAMGLVIWAYFTQRGNQKNFFFVLIPLLTSCVLRVDGAEFWAQTLFETINIIFVTIIILFIYTGNLLALFFALFIAAFSPTIYLAGAADAINFICVASYMIFALFKLGKFTEVTKTNLLVFIGSFVFVILSEVYIVWLPFYHATASSQITSLNYQPLIGRISVALNAVAAFPRCFYGLSSIARPINFIENNYSISAFTKLLLEASTWILRAQMVLFLICTGALIFKRNKNIRIIDILAHYFPIFIIFGVFVFTPLLAGYKYSLHLGIRPDMLYRIYPLYLMLLFGATFYSVQFLQPLFLKTCIYLSILFGLTNLTVGASFIYDVLTNASPVAEASDAPVAQKVAAVNFIASDWQKISQERVVPVDYDLEGKWPQLLTYFDEIYPGAFANGVALDYEFERNYGLKNYNSLKTDRPKREAYYIVGFNYSCACEPSHPCEIKRFGRICVKINPEGRKYSAAEPVTK